MNEEPNRLAQIGAMAVILAILGVMCLMAYGFFKEARNMDESGGWTKQGRGVSVKTVEVDGHKYVVMDGMKSGGIVHAESCPCRAKK